MSSGTDVLDRLKRQHVKYREMADIVASQRSAFSSLDVDAILGLIERKRAILSEIELLEVELTPMKADWANVRATFSPEESRAIQETLDGTRQVLQDLVRLEDEGRAMLQSRREPTSEPLNELIRNRGARGAYGAR
jgi:flagellar biosynthesis/type III secretory pathway chaperone